MGGHITHPCTGYDAISPFLFWCCVWEARGTSWSWGHLPTPGFLKGNCRKMSAFLVLYSAWLSSPLQSDSAVVRLRRGQRLWAVWKGSQVLVCHSPKAIKHPSLVTTNSTVGRWWEMYSGAGKMNSHQRKPCHLYTLGLPCWVQQGEPFLLQPDQYVLYSLCLLPNHSIEARTKKRHREHRNEKWHGFPSCIWSLSSVWILP